MCLQHQLTLELSIVCLQSCLGMVISSVKRIWTLLFVFVKLKSKQSYEVKKEVKLKVERSNEGNAKL